MFVIDQSDTYKWPVKFVSVDEEGKNKTQSFTVVYKRLPQSRIEEISKTEGITDRDFAAQVVTGWEEVTDADGKEVPFTAALLARLLENAGMAATLVTEFMQSIAGGAKRKN